MGCGRTIKEITEWSKYTEEQHKNIVDRLRKNHENV